MTLTEADQERLKKVEANTPEAKARQERTAEVQANQDRYASLRQTQDPAASSIPPRPAVMEMNLPVVARAYLGGQEWAEKRIAQAARLPKLQDELSKLEVSATQLRSALKREDESLYKLEMDVSKLEANLNQRLGIKARIAQLSEDLAKVERLEALKRTDVESVMQFVNDPLVKWAEAGEAYAKKRIEQLVRWQVQMEGILEYKAAEAKTLKVHKGAESPESIERRFPHTASGGAMVAQPPVARRR